MVVEKRLKTINDHRKHYDKFVWIINMKIHFFPVYQQPVLHVQSIQIEEYIYSKTSHSGHPCIVDILESLSYHFLLEMNLPIVDTVI